MSAIFALNQVMCIGRAQYVSGTQWSTKTMAGQAFGTCRP